MKTMLNIAKKEFASFFSSPTAYLFIGAFLAVNLFIFFWVETFFAENLAEVRALFQWMPVLLIFLSGAITMRMWAEERRAGTLELLLTAPVRPLALVVGKFLACLGLVVLALLLTLPLPVSVSFMGPLDWGPVLGGYMATIFLAAAYISIGLYVSARSDNQIVSLIVATLICGLFYLIGSDTLAAFFGNRGGELLQLLGSGSRFASITRGVIDFRDLYYYAAIMGVFLTLNVYGLEQVRWANNEAKMQHRRWRMLCGLMVVNFLVANFWLAPIKILRVDATQGNIYSISEATKTYLAQLKEPLLIRGYFSAQTHPLLAPLVPRLRDLLAEYNIAGGGRVHVEFIDPLEHPELEQEAGQKYGIRPVPFQTASKYQAAVTNSYFDLVIQYGDQFETLGFRDLIEVKVNNEQDLQVELRNPEYDITRAIKKVLYGYQGGGDLFTDIGRPVRFTGYITGDAGMPEELVVLKHDLNELLAVMESKAKDRFTVEIVDPDANDGQVAKQISRDYGFQPMAVSLFDERSFWFYMTLTSGDKTVEIGLPEDLSKEGLQRALEAGLKRFSASFAKTVALSVPASPPPMMQYGMAPQGPQFNALKELLGKEHLVTTADLKGGQVPAEAELLIVVAPENLDDKELFAIDQFLMQGGTVIFAASPFSVDLNQRLLVEKRATGLEEWLQFHGLDIGGEMVLDPQNTPFPVPSQRRVGGFTIQETQLVKYPYFVDIRPDGMHGESGLLAGLQQVTMNWTSPIAVDAEKNKTRTVTRLLESSPDSWIADGTSVQPNFEVYGDLGFPVGAEQGRKLLGVMVEGSFTSFFKGKQSPLLAQDETKEAGAEKQATPEPGEAGKEKEPLVVARQIDQSPGSARIILFGSNAFVNDTVLGIGSSVMRSGYLNPIQLLINSVDWSLEDRGLMAIRGRGHFSRTLLPMSRELQLVWEYMNYGLAFFGLFLIWLVRTNIQRRAKRRYQAILS